MKNKNNTKSLADLLFEEPTPEKPYEEFLWGEDRAKGEEDLDSEIDLYNYFNDFVHLGDLYAMPKEKVAELIRLRDANTYTDVLEVPAKFKYAWRVIELSSSKPPGWVDADLAGRSELAPTLIQKDIPMPMWQGRSMVSWTVDPMSAMQMLTENVSQGDWVCVLRVDLGSNRQDFLGNPDELEFITQDFAWQREVFQVRDTTCDLAAICSKDMLDGRTTQQLMSMVVG